MAQRVNESIEIEAPVEDVCRYWSNFETFSNFMHNFARIFERGTQTPNR